MIKTILKAPPDTYDFDELNEPIGETGEQPSHWIITDINNIVVGQVTTRKATAEWLHERLNTLAYLQGGCTLVNSEARRQASKENGKKGGRPRTNQDVFGKGVQDLNVDV